MAEELKDKKAAPKVDDTAKKAPEAEATETKAVKKKKSKKRLVTDGRVFIQASFNNTITTVTDDQGNVLATSSAGANGFKGPKKATPYAAQVTSEAAVNKAKVYGLERVHVYVKGAGNGRDQAVRGILLGGVSIESITDVTPVAHNGCRPRKGRRV